MTAHLWTAAAYYLIGGILMGTALWVWHTHPINRVFLFGRYLTEDGIRVLMRSWPLVALFGVFILACALDHHAAALAHHDHASRWWRFFSVVEAVISWITALIVAGIVSYNLARRWWMKK